MKLFYSKKKKLIGGLFLGLVIFAGIASPVNYSSVINGGGDLISVVSAQTPNKLPCGTFAFGCHLSVFTNETLPAIISSILLTITSLLLYISGALLNGVIKFTVVDMAQNIGGIEGINVAWKVMRDLANLAFIFILLYIAIGTILRLDGVNTKKLLVRVIIIALLLNFSLFFTKLLIDTSNIITIGFYNKVSTGGTSGLSGAFMNKLGLSSVFDVGATANFVKDAGSAGKILLLGLFGAILFCIAAFIFMAAALMFIIRYVTLIFLLVFSPLAFAAMALPNDKYSSAWWDKLMKNIIFAPVFMIMVWTTLTILSGILDQTTGVGSTQSMLNAINTRGSSMSMVMNFIIVIVTMVATLVVANEIGAAGAKGALSYGRKLRGQTTGWIGRNTVGRYAARLDKRMAESARFGGLADSRAARWARSYTTGALAGATFGGDTSRKDDIKRIKEQKADIKANRRINTLRNTVKTTEVPEILTDKDLAKYKTQAMRDSVQKAQTDYRDNQIDLLQKTYSKMSNKELESLDAKTLTEHAQYLSAGQFEYVSEKSEKFGEEDKEKIKNARFEPLKKAIDDGKADEAKKLTKALSDKEIELLDAEMLKKPEFISNLSQNQIDNILKSSKFTTIQKNRIKEEVIKPLKTAIEAKSATDIATILGKMKNQQIAKLDSKYLLDDNVIAQLTPKMMAEMPKELDSATLKSIGDKIKARVVAGGSHAAHEYITKGRGKDFFN